MYIPRCVLLLSFTVTVPSWSHFITSVYNSFATFSVFVSFSEHCKEQTFSSKQSARHLKGVRFILTGCLFGIRGWWYEEIASQLFCFLGAIS